MSSAADMDPRDGGYVFVLKLEDGCWYVGHSINLYNRMVEIFLAEHRTQWMRKHPPIALQAYLPGSTDTKNQLIMNLGKIYGPGRINAGHKPKYPTGPAVYPFQLPFGPTPLDWQSMPYPKRYRRKRF